MTSTFKKLGLAAAVALALSGCGGDDDNIAPAAEPGPGDNPSIVDTAKYMVVATDAQGYITFIADDGNGNVERVGESTDEALRALDDENPLSLGEVHFTEDGKYAVIVATSGFEDAGAETGGGLVLVDMSTLDIVKQIPLVNTQTQDPDDSFPPTHPNHAYMDGNTIWVNDDGPLDDDATEEDEAAQNDSVFHVNLDCADVDSESCGKVLAQVVVENGHKKSAFNDDYFVTHNASSQSVSFIHKDEHEVENISLMVTPDPDEPGAMLPNIPHGIDYSPVSGKFYTGITNGADMAVAIVDAETLELTSIAAGPAADGKIPAGGYVHAVDGGKWVLTVGYAADAKKGYLSVIDSATDEVSDVIDLGDLDASSFDTHQHDGRTMVVVGASSVGGITNEVKIFHIDNATGKAVLDAETNELDIHPVTIGHGPQHRNGAITLGGERGYYPNACAPASETAAQPAAAANADGDAGHFLTTPRHGDGQAPGTECNAVVSINLMDHDNTDPIAFHNWGEVAPAGIGILHVGEGGNAPSGNNGGNPNTGGHSHDGHGDAH